MTRFTKTAAPVLLAMAAIVLAACAGPAPEPTETVLPGDTLPEACEQVTVIVDFTVLDEPSVKECAAAGVASDILAEAGVTTEGTVDYGDQVVCRVNGQPSEDEPVEIDGVEPFIETCETLGANAFWGLWVKLTPDGEWEFAQEGVATLQLTDGQSVGLVYTPSTETILPQD